MKLHVKPLPMFAALAAALALISFFVWVLRPRPTVPPPATSAAAIEERAREDAILYRERYLSLQRELERVKAERAKLEKLLEELGRITAPLLACIAIALSLMVTPASWAADPPAPPASLFTGAPSPPGRLLPDGSSCFSPVDTAVFRGAYALVPHLKLEISTLREDRSLAAREIGILQEMLQETRGALERERRRSDEWSELERALSAQVQDLQHVLKVTKRRDRLRMAGTIVAVVAGGVVIGYTVAR